MNEGYSELDLCPMCMNVSLVTREDENERPYSYCKRCPYRSDLTQPERETPLGEEIDGGNDHVADEVFGEEFHAQHDDDPSPYDGTYSEE